jgi:hypothetical protein
VGGRFARGQQTLHIRPDGFEDVLVPAHVHGVVERGDEGPGLLGERHDEGGQLDRHWLEEALGQIGAWGQHLDHLDPDPSGQGKAGEDVGLGAGEVILEEEALLGQARLLGGRVARQLGIGDGERLVVAIPELLAEERGGEVEGTSDVRGGHAPAIL